MAKRFRNWKKEQEKHFAHLVRVIKTVDALPFYQHIEPLDFKIEVKFTEDGKPVRRVVNRYNMRATYKNSHTDNAISPQCESRLELLGQRIVQCSPEVKSYLAQPCTIYYELDGKQRYHVPDLAVELISGKLCLIEFKPSTALDDPEIVARSEFLAKYLPYQGIIYFVIVPPQVGGVPQSNTDVLLRRMNHPIDPIMAEWVRKTLRKVKSISLGDLLSRLPSQWNSDDIHGLMRTGLLLFDMFEPITNNIQLAWSGSSK